MPALLLTGAGLIASAVCFAASLRPLWRGEARAALSAIGVLAVVLGLTALRYGFTFLIGAILVGVPNLAALGTL